MLVAPHTPDRECNTRTPPQGGSAGCQHGFAGNGRPHYCSYIQVPGVLATLYPASTPDEHVVVAYLGACTLWWHLQARELAAVKRLLDAGKPLTLSQEQVVCKRLDRCLALAETMQEASALVTRYLITAAPQIVVGFRVDGLLPAQDRKR